MNNLAQNFRSHEDDSDALDLSAVVDVAIENRYWISAIVCVFLVLGGLYSFLRPPIYRADVMVQIEDGTSATSNGLLANIAPLLDMKSSADAEIQLLGSRLVVSAAVDKLHLFINANPRYFPLVGKWIASHNKKMSQPGLFGIGGFVWGTEAIDVSTFDVPRIMEDDLFRIEVLGNGRFELSGADLDSPATGAVGQTLNIQTSSGPIALRVETLDGRQGAQFDLTRSSRLETITRLQEKLDITQKGKDSDVLSATYDGTDPELVSRVMNEIGAQYVKQNVLRKTEEAQRSIDFLNVQLPMLAEKLRQSEEKYNKTRQHLSTVNLGDEAGLVLQQSVDVETQLTALRQKRTDLGSRFATTHPAMQALDAQISALETRSKDIDAQIKQRPLIEQNVLRDTRDVQVNQELYLTLQDNLQQLKLVKAGKVGSVRLVDAAPVPEKPIWPRAIVIIPLAFLGGLFVGFAVALVRSRLFGGVSDSRDIERILGINVYATVPISSEQKRIDRKIGSAGGKTTLLAVQFPDDPAVESLRSFRTALQFSMVESTNNRVMFTGSLPGVGKSFVSANCAAVLALSGRKVLLIDADVRKGHIHRYLGLGRSAGFAELLAGVVDEREAIQRTDVPGLEFISAGAVSTNPGEMFHSGRLVGLINNLSSKYDLVIIDTPPVLAVADAAVLAPHCGTTFLVARAGSTKVAELGESAKRLAQVGVYAKGVVFNGVNPALGKYGYGSAYGGYRHAEYTYGK
ncbi:Tyrosine-protein kinase wzc [Paraburkholderia nemoris]|uniref:polysaccharide biosynthesis tyrosine autokinase n=1 Tax=Paraburkholderia nemoris TaxID=2793076 RepID=UPI00190DEDA7|nr:polysaccharide biosynthesis tyrosine autokinase [Paraburkholderia nemoris]MBK3740879.1 polysaccharide biosynthesis tyrosine autokinase [Paraburkholderia aspalathi]CAE6728744.1 Tyrosine-protein kinase wzc [Paraburkholderia nemoris]